MLHDLENITIERGVTKPHRTIQRSSKWYQLLDTMDVGDSFAFPYETMEEATKIKQSFQTNKKRFIEKYNPDFNGSVRILYIKKEVRFWRDK